MCDQLPKIPSFGGVLPHSGRGEGRQSDMTHKPLLIVVSAPSGAGKSTLCDRLLEERGDIAYSVSCTTRAPRGAEQNGKDYYFITEEEFSKRIADGEFLEYATVHNKRYGTLEDTVSSALDEGNSVIMDIDVQGAAQVRNRVDRMPDAEPVKDGYLDIFIEPPSMDALRERLESRGEDEPDEIKRRLMAAGEEMQHSGDYGCVIVNDDLERAYSELKSVVERKMSA